MSIYESTVIFENQSIHNIFNQYQIQLNYYLDKIFLKLKIMIIFMNHFIL